MGLGQEGEDTLTLPEMSSKVTSAPFSRTSETESSLREDGNLTLLIVLPFDAIDM